MGNDAADAVPGDGEGPARRVTLGLLHRPATVTNREFADFVRATRYVTEAEQLGSSFVFYLQVAAELCGSRARSCAACPGGCRSPTPAGSAPKGPGSHIRDRPDHPVVHVSWNDAQAYCDWAGAAPAERSGMGVRGARRPRRPALRLGRRRSGRDGTPRCNIWRGTFPDAPGRGWPPGPIAAAQRRGQWLRPVQCCGNVWEWCADWFSPAYHRETAADDPRFERATGQRSMRGGSFLCHDTYCNRYRVAARHGNTPDSAASNIGFRVAR